MRVYVIGRRVANSHSGHIDLQITQINALSALFLHTFHLHPIRNMTSNLIQHSPFSNTVSMCFMLQTLSICLEAILFPKFHPEHEHENILKNHENVNVNVNVVVILQYDSLFQSRYSR